MEPPMILYGELTKVEALADGSIRVHGVASTGARDTAGEIVSPDAMRRALPDYLAFGAIREMHQPRAAGAALSAEVDAAGATRVAAHIVDPVAVSKVRAGVYKGLSIGGKVLGRDPTDASVITALRLDEISLVDRPCNPEAVIDLWKAAPSSATPTNAQVKAEADRLAHAAGRPGRRNDYLAKARDGLMAAATAREETSVSPPLVKITTEPLTKPTSVSPGLVPGAQSAAFDPRTTTPRADLQTAAIWTPRTSPGETARTSHGDTAQAYERDGESVDPHLNPQGDVSQAPHGSYADPLAAKYPLDTAPRIRAAWSAIASPANRAGYAADQVAALEARIAAAWRAEIDSAGPPSLSPPSDDAPAKVQATDDLLKLGDLRKLADLERDLASARAEAGELAKRLDAQAAEIERLSRAPLPPRAAASSLAKAIGKIEDADADRVLLAPDDLARALDAMTAAERAHLLMKAALARPIPLG